MNTVTWNNNTHIAWTGIHQSYNTNTVTWNNNTCKMDGDPYDKSTETIHACVTVICEPELYVEYPCNDENNNAKCSTPCSGISVHQRNYLCGARTHVTYTCITPTCMHILLCPLTYSTRLVTIPVREIRVSSMHVSWQCSVTEYRGSVDMCL